MRGVKIWSKEPDTYCNGISKQHDHNDQKKTAYAGPGSLQCSCDHVHLWVKSKQVPQFDSGEQDQESHQILKK